MKLPNRVCKICTKGEQHTIDMWEDFQKSDVQRKLKIVKKGKICYCCLCFYRFDWSNFIWAISTDMMKTPQIQKNGVRILNSFNHWKAWEQLKIRKCLYKNMILIKSKKHISSIWEELQRKETRREQSSSWYRNHSVPLCWWISRFDRKWRKRNSTGKWCYSYSCWEKIWELHFKLKNVSG